MLLNNVIVLTFFPESSEVIILEYVGDWNNQISVSVSTSIRTAFSVKATIFTY